MGKRRGRIARVTIALVLALPIAVPVSLGTVVGMSYGLYAWGPAAETGTNPFNALWAAHKWVGQPHAARDYDDLVAELNRHEISTIFFHAGPMDGDGLIPTERYPNAADLVAQIKMRDPSLQLQAWIGQIERRGGGPLDVSDAATRANIVRTAATFVALGFDGIHYNIEPIFSGDPDILRLLEETAPVTRDRGKTLSLASDEMSPFPGSVFLARLVHDRAALWSAEYYRQVAARVDQVAVMMYDTALPMDWMFGSVVAWETWRILNAVGTETMVFMGVPSYEDIRFGFHPEAENMVSGLRGIRLGLSFVEPTRRDRFGVAVYARWTTDDPEWAAYRRDWLGQP